MNPWRFPFWQLMLLFVAASAVFSALYCQAPLYYSNQNQYFLHGLAHAGEGNLKDDWLANTIDPTPAFSAMVAFTGRYLHPKVFHVYHALLMGVYVTSLVGLFFVLTTQSAMKRWPVFLALLFLLHSALARWLSYRLVGFDYPWFFQAGVAGQYVLASMLQPSVFGVLLVAAIALFAANRPLLAAVCVGAAALMHSTYLLPGALLTVGFQVALLRERRVKDAILLGTIALVLVLPAVAYTYIQFRPTGTSFAEAQDILANVRIPHHCRVDLWIDPVSILQIVWMAVAVVLTYRTRLFLALAVPFTLAALLTVAQAILRNDTLGLLFPWRISAVLVPVATAVVLARLVALPKLPFEDRRAWIASGVMIALLTIAGVSISATRSGFASDDGELPMLAFVRQTKSPGDVYFIPVRKPDLAKTTRGSLSGDFKPLAAKKTDAKLIPGDLQRFRLHTGAAIYVDFKSIPYKDIEVVEWYRRLQIADAIGRKLRNELVDEAVAELRTLEVTHVVWPAGQELRHPLLNVTHADDAYRVYRLFTE